MINHRIRKATLNGASVNTINSKKFDFNYRTGLDVLTSPQKLRATLQSVLKAIHNKTNKDAPSFLSQVSPEDIHNKIADDLIESKNGVIVLGEHLNSNLDSIAITSLIEQIASAADLKIANITLSGNSLSAEKVGFMPDEKGMSAASMFNESTKAFLLMDVDFEYDFFDSKSAQDCFNQEDVFVVALSSFENESLLEWRRCYSTYGIIL